MKINSSFKIQNWGDSLSIWRRNTDTLEAIILDVYKSIPSFNRHYKYFRSLPEKRSLYTYLEENRDSHIALIFILQSDSSFFLKYFDNNIFSLLLHSSSNLEIRGFKMLFSAVISNIKENNNIYSASLKDLHGGFEKRFNHKLEGVYDSGLLGEHPFSDFMNYCIKRKDTPQELVKTLEINIAPHSVLVREVEKRIILKEIDLIKDYSIFSDISQRIIKSNMFHWAWENNELFGHQIIRTILTRMSSVQIHESWVNMILNIASDPRGGGYSKSYRQWWSRIDQELIDKFIKVLSHGDILIFLEALSDFASNRDKEMARMFESRKKLLIGLSLQNKIDESRLFLPERVIAYLKKERPTLNLGFVGILHGSYGKSLIYLKASNIHIIEGSHNCKIRMYRDNIIQQDLLNPSREEWYYETLTVGMERKHFSKYLERPFAKAHDKNGRWKKYAISFLQKSFDLDRDQLMTKAELRRYR